MSHKKHQGDKEAFYKERLRKQEHLDGGVNPLMDTNDIRHHLSTLEPEQILCIATLLFNTYEHNHKHIWFAKGIRTKTITDVIDLIIALQENVFESNTLHDVYTGMGVDDHKRKYE